MSQKKPNFAMKMKTTKIFKIGILTFVALIGSNSCTMAQETDVQKASPTSVWSIRARCRPTSRS